MPLLKISPLFIILFYSLQLPAQVDQLQVGDTFHLNEFKAMNGDVYSLDSLEGKVLVLNFWNIGCRGCELERPYLNEVHENYLDQQDVVFWSVTMNTKDKLMDFLDSHPIAWDIIGGIDFMGLTGDQTFLIQCMPTTMIIDKKRIVQYTRCGSILKGKSGDEFQQIIDKALGQKLGLGK